MKLKSNITKTSDNDKNDDNDDNSNKLWQRRWQQRRRRRRQQQQQQLPIHLHQHLESCPTAICQRRQTTRLESFSIQVVASRVFFLSPHLGVLVRSCQNSGARLQLRRGLDVIHRNNETKLNLLIIAITLPSLSSSSSSVGHLVECFALALLCHRSRLEPSRHPVKK